MEKVCLTTYVYGDKYQDYIPLLIYSIGKSYPLYHAMIFLYGGLRDDIRDQLEIVKRAYADFEIVENTFFDCPRMDALKSKCLRWVLWNDRFLDFDYIYIVDIDILYVPEKIPLHEQHKMHMDYIGSDCVSNMRRFTRPDMRGSLSILKRYGWVVSIRYLLSKGEYRLTGLHFFKPVVYYKYFTADLRKKFTDCIYRSKIYEYTRIMNDEVFLYAILQASGIDTDCMSIQTDSYSSLDPDNPLRGEFRPHHGIHLGIFRNSLDKLSESAKQILNSGIYKYYYHYYRSSIKNDPIFSLLSINFNNKIKGYFESLERYYESYSL